MPEFLQRNPLVLLLGALVGVLLLVLGLETARGLGLRAMLWASTPLKATPVDAKLLPAIADVSPEQLYPETGTRPLFTPTRRPAPAAEAVGAMVKGKYILQGVTILGETQIAMLREKNGSRVFRVEKGKEVDGVTVAEIRPDRVTLRMGGDSEELPLAVQRPAGAGGPPGSPPPPAPVIGPFGAPVPGSAAVPSPPPAPQGAPPVPPAAPRPLLPPGGVPGAPPVSLTGGPMPSAAPAPGTTAQSGGPTDAGAAAPLTPEELLARRRARRAQQAQ